MQYLFSFLLSVFIFLSCQIQTEQKKEIKDSSKSDSTILYNRNEIADLLAVNPDAFSSEQLTAREMSFVDSILATGHYSSVIFCINSFNIFCVELGVSFSMYEHRDSLKDDSKKISQYLYNHVLADDSVHVSGTGVIYDQYKLPESEYLPFIYDKNFTLQRIPSK